MPGATGTELNTIKAGISSWSDFEGLKIVFDDGSSGGNVVNVGVDTSITSVGQGYWNAGAYPPGGQPVPGNQITGGKISFNLGY